MTWLMCLSLSFHFLLYIQSLYALIHILVSHLIIISRTNQVIQQALFRLSAETGFTSGITEKCKQNMIKHDILCPTMQCFTAKELNMNLTRFFHLQSMQRAARSFLSGKSFKTLKNINNQVTFGVLQQQLVRRQSCSAVYENKSFSTYMLQNVVVSGCVEKRHVHVCLQPLIYACNVMKSVPSYQTRPDPAVI